MVKPNITWPSAIIVGIAFLMAALVKITLDPTEGFNDCVISSRIEAKAYGHRDEFAIEFVGSWVLSTGGYHFVPSYEAENPKAHVKGYVVSGNVPPGHLAVMTLQNAIVKYAVDSAYE